MLTGNKGLDTYKSSEAIKPIGQRIKEMLKRLEEIAKAIETEKKIMKTETHPFWIEGARQKIAHLEAEKKDLLIMFN